MKSDVSLDYALFQLTPSRNRCELVVVCGEETERLASGLLKPFVVHLKAAEDQYATGTKEIKLQPPPGYGYGSKPESSAWFTKGTIERFVRFVSTPEVLERVGTVEAELVQLDGAIREHAIESTKVDASQPSGVAATPSAASSLLLTATTDQAPTPTPSRRNSLDEAENPAPDDNARRRLLRAMEARKMLLRKEQGMAFARATAAGFDVQKMEHLLVFADCFGANRLGDACVMYTGIFKKSKESGLWDENEWPLSDTTSLRNVPTSPELRPRESDLWSEMYCETGDYRLDNLKDDVRVRSYSKYYSEDLSLRGYPGADVLLKRNPHALSPNRGRDFNGDHTRSRGGSNQTSWDESSRVAEGQEKIGRSYTDDSESGHTHGMFTDNANESGHELGRAQRQRRAWGPPPQFFAHQIPVGVGLKSKSGPLLSGSDGYPVAVHGTPSSHRVVESLPSWVGQADQPWRPGSTEPGAHGLPRLLVPKAQAQGVPGNGHLHSTEPVVKSPETNGNVLPSPSVSWLEHKRRQGIGMQEKSGIPTPASISVSNSASGRGEEGSRPTGGKGGDRPQSKPVVRRASSPRRRSSSPMRRVQVGRNSMRRSGVLILKSVNYASTKPASNTQAAAKESDPSEEDSDEGPGGKEGVPPQQGVEKLGRSWRDQMRLDTDPELLANLSQEAFPDQSPSRGSSGWNTPVDYETDYPGNGNDRAPQDQTSSLQSPKEPKGRFYEQYREKRDAKLRDELDSKKAERDAKLKSMHEVLEHRKAEMAARKGWGMVKHNSDGEAQVLAEKLRNSKTADSERIKRNKDDDEGKRLEDIANQRRDRTAARSSPSPPSGGTASAVSTTSTPKALEEKKQQQQQQQQQASTPYALPTLIPTPSLTPKVKPHAARRLSSPQKVSAGAFRGTVSAPAIPASVPKLIRPSQRKLQPALPSKEVENPVSRSVPSLAELRKENTKPSVVRNNATRNTGTKIPGIRGTPSPLESNGSKVVSKVAPPEEKKRRAATRKSVAGAMETVPDVLKVVKASPAETKPNKKLSLTSATNGDSKPFLRKGRGIGPGSGPNVRKSKVAAAPEPVKPFEEDVEKSISDSEHEPVKAAVTEPDARDSTSSVEQCKEDIVRPDLTQASQASDVEVSSDVITRPSTPPQRLSLVLDDDDEMIRPEEWQEPELAEDAVRGEAFHSSNADPGATPAELGSENLHSSMLRHFLNEGPDYVPAVNTGTLTPTQRSSPIHSIPLRSFSPKDAECLDQYNLPRADAANAQHEAPVMDSFSIRGVSGISSSPVTSPAPPQLLLSHSPDGHTSSRLRKKWLSSQKVAAPPAVKEAPRGLKRLLKFGLKKKDKSSAASTTSDSPSDIDDDVDFTIEHVGRIDELTHIGAKSLGSRIPGKGSSLMGQPAIPEDSATEGDSGVRLVSIPFVRSSIPTAPAHFKTRDEHVGGSSLLKAPRSFFSLSSFRSKSKQ